MLDTGLLDVAGHVIYESDKMENTLLKGTATYTVKFYKGNWWLFDDTDMPYMMLIPKHGGNQVAQYKVV